MYKWILSIVIQVSFGISFVSAQQEYSYAPWIWESEPPEDCPFEQSTIFLISGMICGRDHNAIKQCMNGCLGRQPKINSQVYGPAFHAVVSHFIISISGVYGPWFQVSSCNDLLRYLILEFV